MPGGTDPGLRRAITPPLLLLFIVGDILGGGIYGFAGYWLGGVALMMGVRGAKGESSYRQARHLLAYALVRAGYFRAAASLTLGTVPFVAMALILTGKSAEPAVTLSLPASTIHA